MCDVCATFRPYSDTCDYADLATPGVEFAALEESGFDASASIFTVYGMTPGDTFSGGLNVGDRDWVEIRLQAGQTYRIDLSGAGLTPLADPYLRLHGSFGGEIASDDDGGDGLASSLVFTAGSTGSHYISAGSFGDAYSGRYTIAVTQISAPDPQEEFTYDQIAAQLTDGYWENSGGAARKFAVTPGGTLTADIDGLTAAGQTLARAALGAWTATTGIKFSFVGSGADITLDDNRSGAFTTATIQGGTIVSANVNVSTRWLDVNGTTLDSYSYQTFLHEIGHALGLGHAGNYNGDGDFGVDTLYLNDSWQASVMSYFSQSENTHIDASFAYILTPMMADIIAMQTLYGTAANLRGGNTRYGENSTAGGVYGSVAALSKAVAFTITDTGGRDEIAYASVRADQVIDLRQMGISDVDGLRGNLAIARGTVIENARGGKGDDRITGNVAANALWGNDGNDRLDGGRGSDTLNGGFGDDRLIGGTGNDTVTFTSLRDITVRLGMSGAQDTGLGRDTITGVENAVTGSGNDVLHGTAGANMLRGNGGADTFYGYGGNDVLEGGNGPDRLFGGAGNDRLDGGAQNDLIDGGTGTDTLVFNTNSNITVRLGTTRAQATGAGNDTVRNVENVLTGGGGDAIYGNDRANVLTGNDGTDSLYGYLGADRLLGGRGNDALLGSSGADTLEGGSGNDTLTGGAGGDRLSGGFGGDVLDGGTGNDLIDGGAGSDTVRFVGARDVTLSLAQSSAQSTGYGRDTVVSVENASGGSGDDTLRGNAGNNRLLGGAGDDTLIGALGNDTLAGGGGDDRLNGGAGNDRLTGGGGADTFLFYTGVGIDIVTDFTRGIDVIAITTGAASLGDLTIAGSGGTAVISFADVRVTLSGIDPAALDASDFIFL